MPQVKAGYLRPDKDTVIVTNKTVPLIPEAAESNCLLYSKREEKGSRKGGRSRHAIEAQQLGVAAHGGDAEGDVCVEFDAQFLRP